MTQQQLQQLRSIREIASDIKREWDKMYFGAVPYVDAMLYLSERGDHYGADSSDDIILRFLSNASAFRGAPAKSLKYQLVQHLSPAFQKDLLKKYKP